MQEQNGSQGPSTGPDFNAALRQAQATADFDYVLDTAKKSHRMLVDFKEAVNRADYPGRDTAAIAMGLNFMDNMIAQGSGQLNALKRAERESKEAVKQTLKAQQKGAPMDVIDPEKPAEPQQPEAPTPEPPGDAPPLTSPGADPGV